MEEFKVVVECVAVLSADARLLVIMYFAQKILGMCCGIGVFIYGIRTLCHFIDRSDYRI